MVLDLYQTANFYDAIQKFKTKNIAKEDYLVKFEERLLTQIFPMVEFSRMIQERL